MQATIAERGLLTSDNAALLMVSGGSDSTALAYLAAHMYEHGGLASVAMLHVNHKLRGQASETDAAFVQALAQQLGIPLFICEIDIAAEAKRSGENVEAVARRERYLAAREALESLCQHTQVPRAQGRIVVAHTADDRMENFYMRSIVGTGPGGFRSMLYQNGNVVRPLLDLTRDDLRAFTCARAAQGAPVTADAAGALWREDATNAHTDRFRAYVRHNMVPAAKKWNKSAPDVLVRTMNLIADEDDMLEEMAAGALANYSTLEPAPAQNAEGVTGAHNAAATASADASDTFGTTTSSAPETHVRLLPEFGGVKLPLKRRCVTQVLKRLLGLDVRIESASVAAVLDAFDATGAPRSGYVANIQGNLAVSANKQGVLIEPMAEFRRRRKKSATGAPAPRANK
jgi:tRNA(Ile)-lysidine synthase